MEKFSYKAKDEKGKTISGIVEARDEKQAVKLLRARRLFVFSIKKQRISFLAKAKTARRISMDDKVNFTRQLSTMISSGLALTEALSILETQASPAMKEVVSEILSQVEGGGNLADAMERHPRAFDPVYIALIRAGEAAGILDNILDRLAENIEKEREFRSKVKGAMIYPAIIILGMIGVSLLMIIFVIPRMMIIYEEFQAELPLTTKILLGVSKLFSTYWFLGAALLVGGLILGRFLSRYPTFKRKYDEIYFRFPVLGNLRKQIMLTEFSRTLGLLVGSGILVVDALNIVKKSLRSPIYEEALAKATTQVEKGFPLAVALAQAEVFPPLLPQMIAVGEETGKIDEVLGKIASYFAHEAEILVKGLTTALEPLIIIVLGIGVAFLVVAVIMPIYNLVSQF